MRRNKKLTLSAMFLALGMVLPFFTAQVKEIGDSLLPMHLPVMLCGLLCGPWYGMSVGLILPILRGAVFSMPPLYPSGIWMACELATYGLVIGGTYGRLKEPNTGKLYLCLVTAMLSGRIVWGIVKTLVLGLGGKSFSFYAFLTGGFLDAFPGIVLQLILIPAIMGVLNRWKNRK